MCESNVYVKEKDEEKLVMENVAAIIPTGDGGFTLKGLLGESQVIRGEIQEINLMAHRIILTPAA